MTPLTRSVLTILVLLVGSARADEPTTKPKKAAPSAATPTVESILAQTAQTYAEAETYQDQGELIEVINPGPDGTPTRALFATKYAKPDKWIFDGRQQIEPEAPPSQFVAWSPGTKKESFYQIADQPPVRGSNTKFSFGLMMGSFTSGIAMLAPSLLGPTDEVAKPELLNPDRKWKLTGSEKVGGADCYQLTGIRGLDKEFDIRLWIDKKTGLIRRYKELASRSAIGFEKTITLIPKLNAPIPASAFQPSNADQSPPTPKANPTKKKTTNRKKK